MSIQNKIGSPFYSNPTLYQLLIRLLYQKNFNSRYEIIADLLPSNSTVVDVCAGDSYLYTRFLKNKVIHYLGIDNSPYFLKYAQKKDIPYKKLNVFKEEIPKADFLIMMGSLFQFHPEEKRIIQKMMRSASEKVIISEPITNVSSSQIGLLAKIANYLTIPFEATEKYTGQRFNEESLQALFNSIPGFKKCFITPGGREMIGIFSRKRNF